MNVAMRLALAFLAAMVVTAIGGFILKGADAGSWAYLGLLLAAIIVGTLVDYENFYGDGRTKPRRS